MSSFHFAVFMFLSVCCFYVHSLVLPPMFHVLRGTPAISMKFCENQNFRHDWFVEKFEGLSELLY